MISWSIVTGLLFHGKYPNVNSTDCRTPGGRISGTPVREWGKFVTNDDPAGPASHDDWERLIAGLRSGDEVVLREFHRRYGPMLHGIAESRLAPGMRRRFDADDVVQSVFRTFFRRARIGYFKFDDNQRLWNLMCAITLTKLREKARFHSRHARSVQREQSVEGAAESSRSELESQQLPPDESVAFADAFETMLSSLDEAEQKLVDLKLQDLTNDEVAETLGVSEKTVRRRLLRLQQKIEGALEGE
jgi:RNA polymerase sigma-70 factor (ECF subfamily)